MNKVDNDLIDFNFEILNDEAIKSEYNKAEYLIQNKNFRNNQNYIVDVDFEFKKYYMYIDKFEVIYRKVTISLIVIIPIVTLIFTEKYIEKFIMHNHYAFNEYILLSIILFLFCISFFYNVYRFYTIKNYFFKRRKRLYIYIKYSPRYNKFKYQSKIK